MGEGYGGRHRGVLEGGAAPRPSPRARSCGRVGKQTKGSQPMSDLTAEQIREAIAGNWGIPLRFSHPQTLICREAALAYADALAEGRVLPRCESCGGKGSTG